MASSSRVPKRQRTGQANPLAEPPLGFISAAASKKYDADFRHRRIIYGKTFDRKVLSEGGLIIDALFEKQGILNFLLIDEKVYPKLLRQFYANLHHPKTADGQSDDSQLRSMVFNREIIITKDVLSKALKLPTTDVHSVTTAYAEFPSYSVETATDQLRGPKHTLGRPLTAGTMNLNCRLIHAIIGYCILPRTGSRGYVSQIEKFLVWAILNGHKLDFGDILFNNMHAIAATSDASLGYGMAFTRILKHLKLDPSKETDVYNPKPKDRYSQHTIKQMGYALVNSRWIPKPGVLDPQGEDDSASEEPTDDEDLADQPSLRKRLDQIFDLLQETNSNVNKYRQELEEFREEYRFEVNALDNKLDSFTRDYYARFPPQD